jgi:hypothetical protein
MPGHWVLARMGKRVLRPGGLDLTHKLLAELAVSDKDDVVEFAPGLGVTARLTLANNPRSYTAVERDPRAATTVNRYLTSSFKTSRGLSCFAESSEQNGTVPFSRNGLETASSPNRRCVLGTAERTGLAEKCASVVYGEAMLSMQPESTKQRIVAEAARVLQSGGRYGIHELCLLPDSIDETIREAIRHDLSDEIHVGVRPLTIREWRELLMAAGFNIVAQHTAPMHLLEPRRLIKDEGLVRALRFAWNVATHSDARQRVLRMRRTFRKFRDYLAAVVIVAQKV